MSESDPAMSGTSADHERSGDDVTEAVDVAEAGSAVREPHDNPEESKSGEAPVEQVAGDADMTEGQVVENAGGDDGTASGPESASSGAAQSQRGARASDLAAAGDD